MTILIRKFEKSKKPKKKYTVVIYDTETKRKKTIHFGEKGYRDYTLMNKRSSEFYEPKKEIREQTKRRYIKRHRGMDEDWNDPFSGAGIWSRYVLWSKPNVKQGLDLMMRKFGMKFEK